MEAGSTMPSGDSAHQWSSTRDANRQQLKDLIEEMQGRMRSVRQPGQWSEIELTMAQFRVLDLLNTGPRRVSDVATALGIGLPSASSLIDRLTDKGLAERQHDTADRRVVTCQITAAGRVEVERLYRIGQARMDLLVEVLTDDELTQVRDAFAVLVNAAVRLSPAEARVRTQTERSIPAVAGAAVADCAER